ncbi:HAD family hydrolase [Senegalimassilia anaerobia]|uniref:HAD family hydrolase n=1 Tax=Senegalimassilia anaerobia TaxID=1473216 RepID=UPI002673F4AB|nr:HAD-IB family hydrolase [Senegalimassilia anaerobia]
MTVQSEAMQTASRNGEGPVRLAAFDFDGTSLDGNSPVMLVKHLAKLRMLNPTVLLRIGLWAAAYKLRLPQNEAWVRGLVFRAFAGKPKAEVDAFLHDFYDECVAPHVREQARQAMDAWHEQGVTVICVSATFEPIIERAMRDLPFDYQISTRMKVNYDGTYACEVDGVPVEGDRKMIELRRFANAKWGEGGWELAASYGDHHSDRALLAGAKQGFAVCPDRPLGRTARERGYQVLEW